MNVEELLRAGNGASELQSLAKQFGLTPSQTEAVIAGVLPEITRRLERNTLSRGGVADLIGMLGAAQASPSVIGGEAGRQAGNELLEQVFGTRDTSRAVAARASYASGVGESIIKAMLPYIIQMVMGSFARRTSGGIGDILSKIPNLGGGAPAPSGGGGSMPFPMPGGGATSPRGGGMLPGPEGMSPPGRNPYGDLSDIIRRGGGSVSGGSGGGGALWRIVRGIIGSALGFQSRGIMSWIVRMVIMRYGWSFLTTILRRMFLGR